MGAPPGAILELADRLWQAEACRAPVRPPSGERPGLLPADAYAVQARNIERRVAAGRVVRGYKVGLASRAIQELLGIGEPISGVLLDDGVLAAIEVNDSRIKDWRVKLADSVADNASSARLILGGRLIPVRGLDLRLTGVLCYRNGLPIGSGAGAAALGHPARSVAWLANQLGARGSGLRRGDIVLSGGLHRMIPVRPGDVIRAEFAHLGGVSAYFSSPDP